MKKSQLSYFLSVFLLAVLHVFLLWDACQASRWLRPVGLTAYLLVTAWLLVNLRRDTRRAGMWMALVYNGFSLILACLAVVMTGNYGFALLYIRWFAFANPGALLLDNLMGGTGLLVPALPLCCLLVLAWMLKQRGKYGSGEEPVPWQLALVLAVVSHGLMALGRALGWEWLGCGMLSLYIPAVIWLGEAIYAHQCRKAACTVMSLCAVPVVWQLALLAIPGLPGRYWLWDYGMVPAGLLWETLGGRYGGLGICALPLACILTMAVFLGLWRKKEKQNA